MSKTRLNLAIKAAIASVISIALLSAAFVGANRLAFAAAIGQQNGIPPITATTVVFSRLDAVPEGYPFPQFYVNHFESVDLHLKSPNALTAEQAAEVGSRYLWEMFGLDISGQVVNMRFAVFPSSTRTHWNGAIWVPDGGITRHIFQFTVDAVTGERISIHDMQRASWEELRLGETVSGGSYERLIEVFTEIAADYAQRHFNFTEVVSVIYEGMRHIGDYMVTLTDADGRDFLTMAGNPCRGILNGETMMHFTAIDETGRRASLILSMETLRLYDLTTQDNDILPGFELRTYEPPHATPRPGADRMPPPTPRPNPQPVSPFEPDTAPRMRVYLGPDHKAPTVQLPADSRFHYYPTYPWPTLQLNHQGRDIDWQFIAMSFEYDNVPDSIYVFRRKVDYMGDIYAPLTRVELTSPGGWAPGSLDSLIPIFDDGYDYIYFVRAVWEEGFTLNSFRVDSGIPRP